MLAYRSGASLDFERMADESEPQYVDSSRLKQVNLELGGLASKHKACRLNSGVFSALGAVVLAISLLGLIHLFPAGAKRLDAKPEFTGLRNRPEMSRPSCSSPWR